MHKSILYITHLEKFITDEVAQRAAALALSIDKINSLKELPAKLLTPDSHYDLIVFDIPDLVSNASVSVFEIINMVSTLTKCCDEDTPALAVLIEPTTDLKLLNDILANDIDGIVPSAQAFGTAETETAVLELLAGRSYVPKHLIDRIKATNAPAVKKLKTNADNINLTARQEQVLRLICNRGASNKSIAKLLNISESTVKLHITAVLKKYGVRNRTQLALFAGSEYRT